MAHRNRLIEQKPPGPAIRGQRMTITSDKPDSRKAASAGRRGYPPGRPSTQRSSGRRSGPHGNSGRSWGRRLAIWAAVIFVWMFVALGAVAVWFALTIPEVGVIEQMTRRPNVTLATRDGLKFASFGGVYGETLELQELPSSLPQAVISIEDRRFYSHGGIDFRGLARAVYMNLKEGRIVQGGSTLTQQLAKNLFLTADRTYSRKFQEVILALWLEAKFSKDQILTIYLNRVYLGAGAYGVDAAARHYFGKSARDLSLYESALLAGLLKAPSRLNPTRNLDAAGDRTELVLQAMVETGYIDQAEADLALSNRTQVRAVPEGQAPYFADWVMAQVREYLGGIDRDIRVKTTLDSRLQRIAEGEVAAMLERDGAGRNVSQAAFLALSADGSVRAMVGGRDYGESQFNRATQALRQPGSAFKPFVYLTAFENAGLVPDSPVTDEPIKIGDWAPSNYGDKYYGEVTLRESFARSLNSVAVRISQEVGLQSIADTARRVGITSPFDLNGSLALGSSEVTLLDLTGAYGTFANEGRPVWSYGIEEISDLDGNVLYQRSADVAVPRVVAAQDVDRMTNLMTAVIEWGTGKAGKLDRPAAGKTGTSQDFRDAWFVGFTAELIAGVWLGNDDNSPMKGVTGGTLPAQLWARVMAQQLEGEPPRPLPGGGEDAVASGDNFITRILKSLSKPNAQEGWTPEEDPTLNRFFR